MSTEPRLTDPVSEEQSHSILLRLCALDRNELRAMTVNLSWALAEQLAHSWGRVDADSDDAIGHASMRLLDQAMQTLDGSEKVDWSVFAAPIQTEDTRGPSVAEDGQSDDTGEHFFSSYGTPRE